MFLRLSHEDLVGNDVIDVTQSQLNRLKKAPQAGKGVTIKMSKSQVVYNMKIQGGFLPLLAGLASQGGAENARVDNVGVDKSAR